MESAVGLMKSFRNEGIFFKQSRLCFGIVASNVAVTPVRIFLSGCSSCPSFRVCVNVMIPVCILIIVFCAPAWNLHVPDEADEEGTCAASVQMQTLNEVIKDRWFTFFARAVDFFPCSPR